MPTKNTKKEWEIMVNSENIMKFKEAVEDYILFRSNNLKTIKKLFLSNIDDN